MKRSLFLTFTLYCIFLAACAPVVDTSGQIATIVAETLTQTPPPATLVTETLTQTPPPATTTPVPAPTTDTLSDAVEPMEIVGLKPPDSDTPASGICAEAQGDPVSIPLGTGPDGLPLAGRCIILHPSQRIELVNHSTGPFADQFAGYSINLPAGKEMLLDKPVGEYLLPGVHLLPMGPELWLKADPLRNYANSEVGYSLTLPPTWNIDENDMANPNKEVIFFPSDAEPFVAYLSISLETRTLEQIAEAYSQYSPDAVREQTIFNDLEAVKYTYPYGREEYFIPHEDRLIMILTDRPTDGTVRRILRSIQITN